MDIYILLNENSQKIVSGKMKSETIFMNENITSVLARVLIDFRLLQSWKKVTDNVLHHLMAKPRGRG